MSRLLALALALSACSPAHRVRAADACAILAAHPRLAPCAPVDVCPWHDATSCDPRPLGLCLLSVGYGPREADSGASEPPPDCDAARAILNAPPCQGACQ